MQCFLSFFSPYRGNTSPLRNAAVFRVNFTDISLDTGGKSNPALDKQEPYNLRQSAQRLLISSTLCAGLVISFSAFVVIQILQNSFMRLEEKERKLSMVKGDLAQWALRTLQRGKRRADRTLLTSRLQISNRCKRQRGPLARRLRASTARTFPMCGFVLYIQIRSPAGQDQKQSTSLVLPICRNACDNCDHKA